MLANDIYRIKEVIGLKRLPKVNGLLYMIRQADLGGEVYRYTWKIYYHDKKEEEIEIGINIQKILAYRDGLLLYCEDTSLYYYDLFSKEVKYLQQIESGLIDWKVMNDELLLLQKKEDYIFQQQTLKRLSLKSGEMKQISRDDEHVIDFDYNGDQVAYVTGDKRRLLLESQVLIHSLNNQKTIIMPMSNLNISELHFLDERSIVFLGIDIRHHSRNDAKTVYCYDLTGLLKWTHYDPNINLDAMGIITGNHISDDCLGCVADGHFYHVAAIRNKEVITCFNQMGFVKIVETELTTINSITVHEEKIHVTGLGKKHLQELYLIDHQNEKQLTHHNEWLNAETLATCVSVRWHIDGWYLLPDQFDENKKYPTVLFIHGGPKAMYGETINHEMECLAKQGYIVLYTNPRGSDGRGDDYADISQGFGRLCKEDLSKFIEKMILELPSIDRTRLGVVGGSYGGYMVNYLNCHTDYFKAAVSGRGISSLVTAFTASDIGVEYVSEYTGYKASVWHNKEILEKESPIYSAAKAKTPTLFIHGLSDVRCNSSESLSMSRALEYHKIPTRRLFFKGEGHGLVHSGQPKNRIKRLETIIEWLNKYLMEE